MSKSISMYKVDPNNSEKQVANSPDFNTQHNNATVPAEKVLQERPNHIIINQPGSYAFAYTSESFSAGTYVSGAIVPGDADAGTPSVQMEIQPVAWKGCDVAGTAGDITFIYKGVK